MAGTEGELKEASLDGYVLLSGMVCLASLAGFLLTKGSYVMNIVYVATFSLSIGVVYCTVAGLMALDIVPRKATGSALGMVGLASYAAAGIQKGSGEPNKNKVGTVTAKQLEEIATMKMTDLNANDAEHAACMIAGTARSMGIQVVG